MKALKTWWKVYAKSVSDPVYYNHIIRSPLSFSLKYYAVFYVLLAFASSIYFVFRLQPDFVTTTKQISAHIQSEYPADLVISLEDDRLSVAGVEEPYHLSFPSSMEPDSVSEYYDQLVTIDSVDTNSYDSVLTLYEDHLTLLYPDGREQHMAYSDFQPHLTIDKQSVTEELPLIEETVLGFISLFPIGIFLFGSTIVPLAMMLVLLGLSAFIYLGTQLGQLRLPFQKCYQIGLHTITFAETARFMQRVLFANFNVPSIYVMAFFGATLFALYSLKPMNRAKRTL